MNIINFTFKSNEIRAFEIKNNAWFVAYEIIKSLGFSYPETTLERHCRHVVTLGEISDKNYSLPFDAKTKLISERDVYRLVFRSKLNDAENLEEKIVNQVLPELQNFDNARKNKEDTNQLLIDSIDNSYRLIKTALDTHIFSDEEKRQMFINLQSSLNLPPILRLQDTEKSVKDCSDLEPFIENALIEKEKSKKITDTKNINEVDLTPLTQRFPVKTPNPKKKSKAKKSNAEQHKKRELDFHALVPLTDLLKNNKLDIGIQFLNKAMISNGIITIKERVVKSRTEPFNDKIRRHQVINEKFGRYGKNVPNPYNQYETMIKWNEENFKELIELLEKKSPLR